MARSDAWEDYRRLAQRKRELVRTRDSLVEEESALRAELAQVEEQVAYYASLARDMKRTLDPPSLGGLLRSLKRE